MPTAYDPDSNTVDLKVRVRDVWTLEPGIGFGRTRRREQVAHPGRRRELPRLRPEPGARVQEQRGPLRAWASSSRTRTCSTPGGACSAHYRTTATAGSTPQPSRGRSISLDSRWSAGVGGPVRRPGHLALRSRRDRHEVRQQVRHASAIQGGISKGLVDGWTQRWLAGYRYDRARFGPAAAASRRRCCCRRTARCRIRGSGMELIQNNYITTENQDQIGRTEDLFLGERLRATLGWSTPAFGADRSAGIYSLSGDMGRPRWQERHPAAATSSWNGRLESGNTVDSVVDANARYYHRLQREQPVHGRARRRARARARPRPAAAARRRQRPARLPAALPDRRHAAAGHGGGALLHGLVPVAPVPRRAARCSPTSAGCGARRRWRASRRAG